MSFIEEFKIVFYMEITHLGRSYTRQRKIPQINTVMKRLYSHLYRLEKNTKKTTLYFHISSLTESTLRINRTQNSSFRIFGSRGVQYIISGRYAYRPFWL